MLLSELDRFNFCVNSEGNSYDILNPKTDIIQRFEQSEIFDIINESPKKIVNLESRFNRIRMIKRYSESDVLLDDINYDLSILSKCNSYYRYSILDLTFAKFLRAYSSFFKQLKKQIRQQDEFGCILYSDGSFIDDISAKTGIESDSLLVMRKRFHLRKDFITKLSDIYDLWFYIKSDVNGEIESNLMLCPKMEITVDHLEYLLVDDLLPILSDALSQSYSRVDMSVKNTANYIDILSNIILTNIDINF